MKNNITLVIGLLVIAVISRFLPHPANFVPFTAIALFCGATISNKKLGVGLSFLSLFVSDLFLGFHSTMFFTYPSLALIVLVGATLNTQPSRLKIFQMAICSSLIFFIVSNLGVWTMQSLYPKNLTGLIDCYIAAIPFYRNSLAGDLIFSFGLFEAYRQLAFKFGYKNNFAEISN
jgi:hypothetical protein